MLDLQGNPVVPRERSSMRQLLTDALAVMVCRGADPITGDLCDTHQVTSTYRCPGCLMAARIRAELEAMR